MSKVKDEWQYKKERAEMEMEAQDMLEEIHIAKYGDDGEIDQLRSDNEDLKHQLKTWISIANKDRLELEHVRADNVELKATLKRVEDRVSPRWEKTITTESQGDGGVDE